MGVWGGNSVLGRPGNEARERTPNGQALAQGAKEAKWASLLVGKRYHRGWVQCVLSGIQGQRPWWRP